MKIEVEYIVRKKAVVEADSYDEVMQALLNTEWANGNILIERKPGITSKVVMDDSITKYNREDGCHHLKSEILSRPIKIIPVNTSEWLVLLKERVAILHKENPHWKIEKCTYIVKQDMPELPKDGWI